MSGIKNLFQIEKNKNHNVLYDRLRVLAVIFVITAHVSEFGMNVDLSVTSTTELYFYHLLDMFCHSCNVIYIMLSGALLLPYREEKLSDFYFKRYTKVLIPMCIYYFIYLIFNQKVSLSLGFVKYFFYALFTGTTPESPHYWLIYAILSIYLVFPFFRFMMKDLPYEKLTSFVVLLLIFMGVGSFLPAFGLASGVSTVLASWIGVAIIGYWITREESRRYDRILMILGAISFVSMCIIIGMNPNFESICSNTSPIIVLITMGLVSICYQVKSEKESPVTYFISKYSYSIILIHWLVLQWERTYVKISVNQFLYLGTILIILIVLLVSLCVAFVLDNLVINPIMTGVNRLRRR